MLCTASRERKFCDHEMKIKQGYFLSRTNSPRKFLNVFVLKAEQKNSEISIKVHLCNVTNIHADLVTDFSHQSQQNEVT